MGANESVEISFKKYDSEDYVTLCEWWNKREVCCPSKEDLGDSHGVIARRGAMSLGAGFLFVTGGIGFIEALVLKPGLGVSEARRIGDDLHENLRGLAKIMGVRKLIAFVQSRGMVRECERVGFNQVGMPMAQMVQIL